MPGKHRDQIQHTTDRPRRQFSTWHQDGSIVLCFGGYDGHRQASVVWKTNSDPDWIVAQYDGDIIPPPLQHHRSVLRRRSLIVIGGRTRPLSPLGLYILDLDQWRWHRQAWPEPRYRHGLAHDHGGDRVFISGGLGTDPNPLSDLWVLDLGSLSWRLLPQNGECRPDPRHSHSLIYHHDRLLMFGGMTGNGAGRPTDRNVYQYDIACFRWSIVDTSGDIPPPIYSHISVLINNSYMLILGGIANTVLWGPNVFLFNIRSRIWFQASNDILDRLRKERLLIGHDIIQDAADPFRLTIMGGGATCFSFGRWTDEPTVLELATLFPQCINNVFIE